MVQVRYDGSVIIIYFFRIYINPNYNIIVLSTKKEKKKRKKKKKKRREKKEKKKKEEKRREERRERKIRKKVKRFGKLGTKKLGFPRIREDTRAERFFY